MAASGVEIRHPFLGVNVVPAGTPVLMASGHPVGNGTIVERGVERLVRVRGFVRASTSAASLYPISVRVFIVGLVWYRTTSNRSPKPSRSVSEGARVRAQPVLA